MNFIRLGHIATGLLTLVLAGVAVTSCSGDSKVVDEPPTAEGELVNLVISVGVPEESVPGQSRVISAEPGDTVYFEEPDTTRYERMHTLRVIIISEGGDTIEHNKMFTLNSSGEVLYDDMTFEVKGGDKKTIYLFANEKGLQSNDDSNPVIQLTALKAGDPATMASILDQLTLKAGDDGVLIDNTGDEKTYIPMSEKYTGIEVKPRVEARRQTLPTMFVNRAATKFSFSITPYNNEDMALRSIKFTGVAYKEYILPKNTTYKPDKGTPTTYPFGGRFVINYDIPPETNHKPFTFTPPGSPVDLADYSEGTPYVWEPELYFCESKMGSPDAIPEEDLSTANYSPYNITITVARKLRDKDGNLILDGDGKPQYDYNDDYTYPAVILPNLPTLPRNTHVKVNIKIYFLNAVVELVPYTGVWLDPIFGIDR